MRWAGPGAAATWALIPMHPSQWSPEEPEWGRGYTEMLPKQRELSRSAHTRPRLLGSGGAPHPNTASCNTRGMAPQTQSNGAKDPCSWVQKARASLATPFLNGLMLNEPLTTKASKGISEKCNFHLGRRVFSKHHPTTASPFSTSKGKGN